MLGIHFAHPLVLLDRRAFTPLGERFVAFFFPVAVDDFLSLAHLEERRLRDEEMPALDELGHVTEEECEQQRADVRTVHVRIRHDVDAVVAQLADVEIRLEPIAERSDERADLFVPDDLVQARLLDVEDLAAQRQDGLEMTVASGLRAAAGGLALDEEYLTALRVAFRTVRELARQ
jgi:hypothetical protein